MDAMLIMEIANILSTMQTVCPWRKCVRSSEKVVYMELAQRLLLGWESSLANHQGDGGGVLETRTCCLEGWAAYHLLPKSVGFAILGQSVIPCFSMMVYKFSIGSEPCLGWFYLFRSDRLIWTSIIALGVEFSLSDS